MNSGLRRDKSKPYDVIVCGGGHAGCEAALSAAHCNADVLMLTGNLDTIAQMSCNPAIGGIGKGHLTKEIDAMGGVMAEAIDKAGIHFRTLNASKGPAVRATRAQADRVLYNKAVKFILSKQKNLTIHEDTVDALIIKNGIIGGVIAAVTGSGLANGIVFQSKHCSIGVT